MKRKNQKKEIIWNIVNSILSGALVLVGAFSGGSIDKTAIIVAVSVSVGVALTKFKEYWDGEKKEYSVYAFRFL